MEIYSSEEQQVEAIKRFWHEYGKAILAGVVLGLAALYGFRFYQAEQRNTAEAASTEFSRLVEQRGAAGSEDWLAQAQDFVATSDANNYAVMAALLAAKDAVTLQQYDKAAEQLSWVLANSKQPALLAVTQLRLARLQQEQGNFDAALTTLAQPVPDSFIAIQAELKGDILMQADKLPEAKAAYQQALAAAGQNQQLLKIKLDELAHVTAV
ncbi:YfgM family protein [Rheinheimera sp. NSM]|uniref:YfgM family protein n=1 Tax=Rheinheimera sp. NSM TaxID=3457884 RepID=UPI00403651A4